MCVRKLEPEVHPRRARCASALPFGGVRVHERLFLPSVMKWLDQYIQMSYLGSYPLAKVVNFVTMKVTNHEVFHLHAEFCKVLANPKRLMIIALLSKQEMSVGELAEATETALPTISQHLRVLREHHIVATRKEGQTVYSSLVDPRIMEACTKIRAVLLDSMKRRGVIAREIDPLGVSRED